MDQTPTRIFVPVVAGSRGRRGFDRATTTHLVELLARYKTLRDDRTNAPAVRAYAREVVAEIRHELGRRQQAATEGGVAS